MPQHRRLLPSYFPPLLACDSRKDRPSVRSSNILWGLRNPLIALLRNDKWKLTQRAKNKESTKKKICHILPEASTERKSLQWRSERMKTIEACHSVWGNKFSATHCNNPTPSPSKKQKQKPQHPVICGDDVRSGRLSRGSVHDGVKGPLSWGFSCSPLSSCQPVLSGKKN